MAKNYGKLTVGDVVQEIYDAPHATPEKTEEGPIFLGVSNLKNGRIDLSDTDHISEEDFQNRTSRVTPQEGDIVFSYETRLGEAALIPDGLRCCLGRRMGLLRVDKEVAVPRYLLYAWLSPEFQREIQARASQGSTVNRILLTELGDYPIRVPPLPVQRRIADVLGALDDKIELNRRMNETLEEMAQALYRHWFVEFGPFQDREFTDTEALGPIPKGWEVTTVGDTTHINLGQSPKSKYYNQEGDGLVFHQGVSTYGWRFPVHERYCSKKKRVADEGDILISVRAPVGRLNIADRKLIIGRGLTALRREDGNQSFLFYFLKEFFDEENKIGSGTVFNSITKSVLNDLEMIGPPPEVVEEFESIVGPMDEQIRNNHEENKTLAEIRDYLLPKLISGEIEVDAAQEVAEDTIDAPA